jgi:chromosome segregation ATPase
MPLAQDMKNIVEDIISSYETRLEGMGVIFDTTYQLLQGFQDSFIDKKQEREKLIVELRNNLAKNNSLRKNDFDNMMQDILSTQDKREKEVRNLLNRYLNERKEMAQALRGNLEKFKDSLAKGEIQRVKEFQNMIKEVIDEQEKRKDEVTSKLKAFQKEQKEMAKRLKELLAKDKELRIEDLKSMLERLKIRNRERTDRQEQRKKEVHGTLSDLKKERLKSSRTLEGRSKANDSRKG